MSTPLITIASVLGTVVYVGAVCSTHATGCDGAPLKSPPGHAYLKRCILVTNTTSAGVTVSSVTNPDSATVMVSTNPGVSAVPIPANSLATL